MATESQLIADLREMISDSDPEKNILNSKQEMYSDTRLKFFLTQALKDINSDPPRTNYTLETFPDTDLLILGGTIFCCISEGILQLRNQLDYSDAGLSISMFNKTGGYQGWAGFLLQLYMTNKMQFKRSVIPSSQGAGFYGIRSQFSSDWGTY